MVDPLHAVWLRRAASPEARPRRRARPRQAPSRPARRERETRPADDLTTIRGILLAVALGALCWGGVLAAGLRAGVG